MRPSGPVTAILSLVLASGCLGGDDDASAPAGTPEPTGTDARPPPAEPAVDPTPRVAPTVPVTAPAGPAWLLDCRVGLAVAPPWPHACASRASSSPRTKAEMWVGVNPTDPANVVIGAKDMDPAKSDACVWDTLAVTHDGGASWEEVVLGGPFEDRAPPSLFWGYGCSTDPMFRFAADGTLHVLLEMYALAGVGDDVATNVDEVGDVGVIGSRILLATSRDGGRTFPDVVPFQPDSPTLTDFSRMAVSPATGSVFAVINHFTGGFTCNFLGIREGDAAPAPPLKLVPGDRSGSALCRGLTVSPDGTVVVAFRGKDLDFNDGSTRFLRSTDDGLTFADSNDGFTYTPVPGFFEGTEAPARPQQNFEVLYDLSDGPGRGTLWAIYADASAGDADVFVRASADDGLTWGDPVRIHRESAHHQWMANLAIAPDGSMHAFYFDKRYDPDDRLIDVSHAWSLDGGVTWSDERVTTTSWDADLGRHQFGYPWIGDYIGVDAAAGHVWAAFPDTTHGDEPVIAAAHVAWG